MRKLTLLLFVAILGFTNYSYVQITSSDEFITGDAVYTSHVIIKIPGFTIEQHNKLAASYLKRQDVHIEYYCLEAGILIMHYNHFGLSNADIEHSVKTELQRTTKSPNIRILDVETRDEDEDSRC